MHNCGDKPSPSIRQHNIKWKVMLLGTSHCKQGNSKDKSRFDSNIPFGEWHFRIHRDFALAPLNGHHTTTQVPSFTVDLDALLQELLLTNKTKVYFRTVFLPNMDTSCNDCYILLQIFCQYNLHVKHLVDTLIQRNLQLTHLTLVRFDNHISQSY